MWTTHPPLLSSHTVKTFHHMAANTHSWLVTLLPPSMGQASARMRSVISVLVELLGQSPGSAQWLEKTLIPVQPGWYWWESLQAPHQVIVTLCHLCRVTFCATPERGLTLAFLHPSLLSNKLPLLSLRWYSMDSICHIVHSPCSHCPALCTKFLSFP